MQRRLRAEVTSRGPLSRERLMRLRLMLVALSVCLWALGIGARLLHLQVFGHEVFERLADRQSERTLNLDPRRGTILDRHGAPLAVSVDADSIYAVPTDIEDPSGTAAALARVLGLKPGERRELEGQLERNRAFVWVRRKVDPATSAVVKELQLAGIGFLTETRRYYPKRELAAHVLGYVGLDNLGMSGIEYSFDQQIRGRAAKVVVRTDARRRPVEHVEKPSTEGHTVVLTLDEALQYVAESELERAMQETAALAGMVVVLDPHTGEVLAMANRPTFNPNRFGAYSSARWRNRAVVDAFEPGSVFKILTAAAGLQEGVVSPSELIDCGNGSIEIAGTRINDHAVFDQLSFRDVIARSSDVGVIRVAQRLGREHFDHYLRLFGFGARSGIELPGESPGILRPPARWSALSLASMSFGQEIGVTALQMASATAAVANGGYLMRPLIVKQVEDQDGRVVSAARPVALHRVLEPETVEVLNELLQEVVRSGTGRNAAIAGYTVAGKTGTAQKVDASGRYSMVDHVASFVGYAPAARPAVVVMVSLDTPRGPKNQGGDVAAPLFARIAEQALRHLAVPPEQPERLLRMVSWRAPGAQPVAYSVPQPSAPTAPEPWSAGEPARMPDLRGRSAREAAIAAARRGLVVELEGSGWVISQSPAPGTELEAGMSCRLVLGRERPEPVPTSAPPAARGGTGP